MSMYNSKDSQLKLTNSSDSNCVGRQTSNDIRMYTTLGYCILLFICGEKVSRFSRITWQPRNFFGEFL